MHVNMQASSAQGSKLVRWNTFGIAYQLRERRNNVNIDTFERVALK